MQIQIKTQNKEFLVTEGRPVVVQFKGKSKTRCGTLTAVGWIKRGENSHCVQLIQTAFSTYDRLENEYLFVRTIWNSSILDIKELFRRGKQ